jgi:gas vesicle protein
LITSIDLTKLKADLAFRVEHLQEEIEQLTTQWSDLSQEKIQQWIGYLKTTTDELKNDVGEYVQDLDEKHQLTTKLTKLKDHITDLQTKVKG